MSSTSEMLTFPRTKATVDEFMSEGRDETNGGPMALLKTLRCPSSNIGPSDCELGKALLLSGCCEWKWQVGEKSKGGKDLSPTVKL